MKRLAWSKLLRGWWGHLQGDARIRRVTCRRGTSIEALESRALLASTGLAPKVTPAWFADASGATASLAPQTTPVAATPIARGLGTDWIVQLSGDVGNMSSVASATPLFAQAPFRAQVVRGLGEIGRAHV